MPQLAQRLRFDLTDAFACDLEHFADLLQRARAAVFQPEAQLQDALFTRGECVQDTSKSCSRSII